MVASGEIQDAKRSSELEAILETVKQVHETLHAEGVKRLSTAIKLGTRTDKEMSLKGKLSGSPG